jgi:hypothetical protein
VKENQLSAFWKKRDKSCNREEINVDQIDESVVEVEEALDNNCDQSILPTPAIPAAMEEKPRLFASKMDGSVLDTQNSSETNVFLSPSLVDSSRVTAVEEKVQEQVEEAPLLSNEPQVIQKPSPRSDSLVPSVVSASAVEQSALTSSIIVSKNSDTVSSFSSVPLKLNEGLSKQSSQQILEELKNRKKQRINQLISQMKDDDI